MSSAADDISEFCTNVLDYGALFIFGNVGIVMVILGVLYIVTSFLIIYFIKLQKTFAEIGDSKAQQSVVFPVYINVLWANALVNVFIGMISFTFDFHPYGSTGEPGDRWAFATMWGLQHTVVEGVAILLMQKGLGSNAAKRSFKTAAVWGIWTMFVQVASYETSKPLAFTLSMSWSVVLLFFYGCLWLLPQRKLYRRPAAIVYSRFWFLYRLLCISASILYYFPQTFAAGNCLYIFGCVFSFAMVEPFVLYFTFLQDCRWWQGMDISQGRRALSVEEIRSPLAGVDLNHQSALSLAASLDTLSVSPSSRAKQGVRLLNFAYISMDQSRLLGSGSFSKVYRGKYRNKVCAIKLIFTVDLTEDVIRRIAAEAQLLSSIKHPNVVDILGVSVLPPSVCILLELCQYGSLTDIIGGTGSTHLGESPYFISEFIRGGPVIGKASSRGLNISWTDRLYLIVGCARGLAALHRFSPSLCHRDVKSYNFVVDGQLNAKISDLELGITDDLLVNNRQQVKRSLTNTNVSLPSKSAADTRSRLISSLSVQSGSSTNSRRSHSVSELAIGEGAFQADEFLANWAAPEVVKFGRHSQASDIYSLGLVMWELLSGSVPFSDIKKQDDIRYKVLNGDRPAIAALFEDEAHKVHFQKYISIIQKCWTRCEEDRPTADQLLAELEMLWKGRCFNILRETDAIAMENSTNSGRLNGLFSPKTQSLNIASSEDLAPVSVRRLQLESSALQDFASSGESWLILVPDTHLTVLWATPRFEDMTGIALSQLQGQSFAGLSLFESVSAANKNPLSLFFQKLREPKQKGVFHVMMELETTHMCSLHPDEDINTASKRHLMTLFSMHCFPIATKSPKPAGVLQEHQRELSMSRPVSISVVRPTVANIESTDLAFDSDPVHETDVDRSSSFAIAGSSPLKTVSSADLLQPSGVEDSDAHEASVSPLNERHGDSSPPAPTAWEDSRLSKSVVSLQFKLPSVSLVAILFNPLKNKAMR